MPCGTMRPGCWAAPPPAGTTRPAEPPGRLGQGCDGHRLPSLWAATHPSLPHTSHSPTPQRGQSSPAREAPPGPRGPLRPPHPPAAARSPEGGGRERGRPHGGAVAPPAARRRWLRQWHRAGPLAALPAPACSGGPPWVRGQLPPPLRPPQRPPVHSLFPGKKAEDCVNRRLIFHRARLAWRGGLRLICLPNKAARLFTAAA